VILAVSALTSGHGPHVLLFVFIAFLVARFFLLPRRMSGIWGPRRGAGRPL
jgi:hypothetical protein